MIISVLAFLVGQQPGPDLRKGLTPTGQFMPIGARPEFQSTVFAIQDALKKGDTAKAKKLSQLLPKAHFTIGWDESSIPESLREPFRQAREFALRDWKRVNNLEIAVAPSGDLNIKFAKGLPKGQDGLPSESVLQFGENPRLNVTIGLERGVPPQPIIDEEAWMEINHAIGAYLGVADDKLADTCMYRDNRPALKAVPPSTANFFVVSHNLKISDLVRKEIDNQVPIAKTEEVPSLVLTSPKTTFGSIRQGLKVPLDFTLKNTGKGVLAFSLVPDCNCFSRTSPGVIPPGGEANLRTIMNTAGYIGPVEKRLVLRTNDPNQPVVLFQVTFRSIPAAHLYRPEGDTILLPQPKNQFDILMTVPDDSKVVPQQYEWVGMDAKVTMEKWAGIAPDPDEGEPALKRHGYVFHVKVGENQIPGRTSGTLNVTTNDEEFPLLSHTIFAQKGILAFPSELLFGAVSALKRISFEVSRPTKPFKVLDAEVGSKSLKAVVSKVNESQYKVDAFLDPSQAAIGDFSSFIKIKTSDSEQPEIIVPVRGTIQ